MDPNLLGINRFVPGVLTGIRNFLVCPLKVANGVDSITITPCTLARE